MKKFLILSVILISSPVFAACPIDGVTNACSIAQIREPFKPTYTTNPMIKEYSGSPESRLTPSHNTATDNQLRNFRTQNSDYSYNSNCQFGVCHQDRTDTLFQKR